MDKIKRDLAKAAALKRERKYDVDAWTFITPRKLADDVIAAMRALARKVEFVPPTKNRHSWRMNSTGASIC